jgi:hypothetical protein
MLNEVLTVERAEWREVTRLSSVNCPAGYFLVFAEVPTRQGHWDGIAWPLSHFRPLVTDEQREADLAQFRKLLTIREPEAA